MRSSAPRSWTERAMDVDDRDVTILDLDPIKSLASQTGDKCKPSLILTDGPSRVKVCEDDTETIKKDEDEPRNKTSTGVPYARRPSVAGQDTSPRGDRDRRQRDAGSLPTRAGNAAGVADYTEPGRGAAGVDGTGTPAVRRPSVAGQDTSPQGDGHQRRGAAVEALFVKRASLTGIKLWCPMGHHVTKARGGSVIISLVDLCRQNLDQQKIAEGWGFNQRPRV